jgi:hypothetical protein
VESAFAEDFQNHRALFGVSRLFYFLFHYYVSYLLRGTMSRRLNRGRDWVI